MDNPPGAYSNVRVRVRQFAPMAMAAVQGTARGSKRIEVCEHGCAAACTAGHWHAQRFAWWDAGSLGTIRALPRCGSLSVAYGAAVGAAAAPANAGSVAIAGSCFAISLAASSYAAARAVNVAGGSPER